MTSPFRRAAGAAVAFLTVGLFVKFALLRLTYELPFDSSTLRSRAAEFWMAMRFSWQEFAIAAALFGLLLAWSRRVPEPGRGTRAALGGLCVLLAAGAIISVAGIRYYAMYYGHVMVSDFSQNLVWALEIAASANLFQMPAARAGIVGGVALLVGLPWVWGRMGARTAARLTQAAFAGAVVMAAITWAAGRPRLNEAQLEPNPVAWFLIGPLLTYFDLPATDVLAPIGEQWVRLEPAERPRNVILVLLESTPADAIAAYNSEAPAGRRLLATFPDEITQFDQIFAVAPITNGAMLSVLTGHGPVPSDVEALRASAARPTLAEALKTRGAYTEYLMTGPSNDVRAALVARGFDRARFGHDDWPRRAEYPTLTWGPDDRMIFDEARAFLSSRPAGAPPFFLMLMTSNPHYPYDSGAVPGLRFHPDAKIRHQRLVDHVVDQLTDLYALLKTSGLADSTLLLAFGDHGEAFGERLGNHGHAKELYPENLHVPMLLLHPRRLGLPRHITQLGSLDDVMPTVLDLMGIDPPPPGSGMSLLREAPDRILFHVTPFGPGVVGFRDRRYAYSLSRTGRQLLFDRIADPRELLNIRRQRPAIAARFRERLGDDD